MPFNDPDNLTGIVQMYEEEIGVNQGDISGNTAALKRFTARVNRAFDRFLSLAINASGTHQYDDSNHTDHPIITTSLVSGQADYTYLVDENNNFVLDIHKVLVADSAGTFSEVKPVDPQSETDTIAFSNTVSGTPSRYDKTGNSITLDPIPNYTRSGGLRIYINRTPSYLVYTDTTKKPGIPAHFHRYLVLKAAEDYARRNQKKNFNLIAAERMQMEEDIKEHFGHRNKDERKRLKASTDSNK